MKTLAGIVMVSFNVLAIDVIWQASRGVSIAPSHVFHRLAVILPAGFFFILLSDYLKKKWSTGRRTPVT